VSKASSCSFWIDLHDANGISYSSNSHPPSSGSPPWLCEGGLGLAGQKVPSFPTAGLPRHKLACGIGTGKSRLEQGIHHDASRPMVPIDESAWLIWQWKGDMPAQTLLAGHSTVEFWSFLLAWVRSPLLFRGYHLVPHLTLIAGKISDCLRYHQRSGRSNISSTISSGYPPWSYPSLIGISDPQWPPPFPVPFAGGTACGTAATSAFSSWSS
jgi:hypothetical protein